MSCLMACKNSELISNHVRVHKYLLSTSDVKGQVLVKSPVVKCYRASLVIKVFFLITRLVFPN